MIKAMNETISEQMEKIKAADDLDRKKALPIDEEAFKRYSNDIFNFFMADTKRKKAKTALKKATVEYNEALAEQRQ